MSDDQNQGPPDVDAIAREYLALWQRQLSDAAADETLAKTMADAMRMMTAGAQQMAVMSGVGVAAAQSHDKNTHDGADDEYATPSGTAAAGTAHRDDDGAFDELHRRVAALEERIAVLESEAEETRRRTRQRGGGNSRR